MSILKVNTINAATSGQGVAVDVKNPRSFRNLLINGQFQIWQRKTDSGTITSGSPCIADRWEFNTSGSTSQITRETFTEGQTDVSDFPQYYHRAAVSTGADDAGVRQKIEDVRSVQGEHTVSFWARGTNPAGGSFNAHIRQDYGDGGTAYEYSVIGTVTLNATSTTWTKYSFTFTPNSLTGKTIGDNSYFQFAIKQAGDDAGTAAWTLDLANVQLEKGSVPTDFERRSRAEELARCQRYCLVINVNNADYPGFSCIMQSDSNAICTRQIPVAMRTLPTYTGSSTDCCVQSANNTSTVPFSDFILARNTTTPNPTTINIRDDDIGGGTAGQGGILQAKANNGSMIFDAEL